MDPFSAIHQLRVPLLLLNNIVALGLKPGLIRVILTLPIALCLVFLPFFHQERVYYGDEFSTNFFAMSSLFVYVDWILLANPDKERWHKVSVQNDKKNDDEATKEEVGVVPDTF
jgi:hypothetical protein